MYLHTSNDHNTKQTTLTNNLAILRIMYLSVYEKILMYKTFNTTFGSVVVEESRTKLVFFD